LPELVYAPEMATATESLAREIITRISPKAILPNRTEERGSGLTSQDDNGPDYRHVLKKGILELLDPTRAKYGRDIQGIVETTLQAYRVSVDGQVKGVSMHGRQIFILTGSGSKALLRCHSQARIHSQPFDSLRSPTTTKCHVYPTSVR
jgi:hypothetical protein